MCQEQSIIHPLCNHFTTRRLVRCYPRGRSSQCIGKTIVSQLWADTQLCASCRAVGHPTGEATTNPLLPPWATPYYYSWYLYGAPWGYSVTGGENESGSISLGSSNAGSPPPYTPSNTGATVATTRAARAPAAPTATTTTTTTASPPPPPPAVNPWTRLMSRTPSPPPPSAPPRQHPWEQYFTRTPAPPAPAPPAANPWNSYQAPRAQPSASASFTAASAESGWSGLMGTSAARTTSGAGGPRATFTGGSGNAVPSVPTEPAVRGSGWGALNAGSGVGGSAACAATGAGPRDLSGSSNSGWAELMVRSCRASQE
ncbi:hypothetical protein EV426DRAFT_577044 [Tirmania nivea]|nr:hypothetical protein EV426DRAFT_577044 [Tirmania nivea]